MKSSPGNGKSVVGRAGRGSFRWEGGGRRAGNPFWEKRWEGGEGGGTSVVDTDHGEMNKELD